MVVNATAPHSNRALGTFALSRAKLLKVMLATTLVTLAALGTDAASREVIGFGAFPNDDKDDAKAIQKAIDASTAGDTV
jgi:hypothetical protein